MGGGHTSAELVAAVSNAGGLGIFGASWMTAAEIHEQTARIRELTSAPFGLNLLLFAHEDDRLDGVLSERPAVLSFAWPTAEQSLDTVFARAHEVGARVMHMVPSLAEARRAADAGADIIVAQGTEGGGHVGMMSTIVLVAQVVRAVPDRPVLAAGGIADGRGLAAALALGAAGVVIGTRFLATDEAPIPDTFKRAIVASDGHDTELTTIPDIISGRLWPGALPRTWRNTVIRQWAGREWELRQRRAAVRSDVLAASEAGDADHALLWFGQDAGLIDAVQSAADVVHSMVREAADVIAGRLRQMVTDERGEP
jgi:NAD(P)H-dependent flavin oxidoreductase YrpB (nitropropane dioxygenase family)